MRIHRICSFIVYLQFEMGKFLYICQRGIVIKGFSNDPQNICHDNMSPSLGDLRWKFAFVVGLVCVRINGVIFHWKYVFGMVWVVICRTCWQKILCTKCMCYRNIFCINHHLLKCVVLLIWTRSLNRRMTSFIFIL